MNCIVAQGFEYPRRLDFRPLSQVDGSDIGEKAQIILHRVGWFRAIVSGM